MIPDQEIVLNKLVDDYVFLWGRYLPASFEAYNSYLYEFAEKYYVEDLVEQPLLTVQNFLMSLRQELPVEDLDFIFEIFEQFLNYLVKAGYISDNPLNPYTQRNEAKSSRPFISPKSRRYDAGRLQHTSGNVSPSAITLQEKVDSKESTTVNVTSVGVNQKKLKCTEEDFMKKYFEDRTTTGRKKLKGGTPKAYKGDYKMFFKFLEDNGFDDISIEAVDKYIKHLESDTAYGGKKPYAPKTKARKKDSLKSLLDYGIKKKLLDFDKDYLDEEIYTEQRERTALKPYRALTFEQTVTVLKYVRNLPLKERMAILIILIFGLRCYEAVRIRKFNFDLAMGVLHVIDTKNGLPRDITIPGFMYKEIKEWLKHLGEEDYLFGTRESEFMTERRFRDLIKTEVNKIGLERRVTPHDLRKTFATNLLYFGKEDIVTISEWMGHQDIRETGKYIDKNSKLNDSPINSLQKLYNHYESALVIQEEPKRKEGLYLIKNSPAILEG